MRNVTKILVFGKSSFNGFVYKIQMRLTLINNK